MTLAQSKTYLEIQDLKKQQSLPAETEEALHSQLASVLSASLAVGLKKGLPDLGPTVLASAAVQAAKTFTRRGPHLLGQRPASWAATLAQTADEHAIMNPNTEARQLKHNLRQMRGPALCDSPFMFDPTDNEMVEDIVAEYKRASPGKKQKIRETSEFQQIAGIMETTI